MLRTFVLSRLLLHVPIVVSSLPFPLQNKKGCDDITFLVEPITSSGLEITAGQRTMSGLIVDLTGQTFVLPVMLTGQNSIVLKMK